MGGNTGRIDETDVGSRYGEWFTRGLRGIGMRYVFSRRGLWVINTPYRRILGAAGVTHEDRVLDLGCGIGNILIALAERIEFVHPAAGVDVSFDLIRIGRREVARVKVGKVPKRLAVAVTPTAPYRLR